MYGVHRFKKKTLNNYLGYFFKEIIYGIHFNSLQDAKRFEYAFL